MNKINNNMNIVLTNGDILSNTQLLTSSSSTSNSLEQPQPIVDLVSAVINAVQSWEKEGSHITNEEDNSNSDKDVDNNDAVFENNNNDEKI